MKNFFKNRKHFYKFLFSYLVIVLMGFILIACINNYNKKLIIQNTVAENDVKLTQVMNILDRNFNEFKTLSKQICNSSDVLYLSSIHNPLYNGHISKILSTQKNISPYGYNSTFMLDYFLIFKNSNLALNSETIVTLDDFYKHYLTYKDLDFNKWSETLFSTYHNNDLLPCAEVKKKTSDMEIITYVQSLDYLNPAKGVLTILIDANEFKNLFSPLSIGTNGFICIKNNNGDIIYSLNEDNFKNMDLNDIESFEKPYKKINNILVTKKVSSQGWNFIIGQPYNMISNKSFKFNIFSTTITILFLIIGFFISYFMAYINSKPIDKILNFIYSIGSSKTSTDTKSNSYEDIHNTILNLKTENDDMQSNLAIQASYVKDFMVTKLLTGETFEPNEKELLFNMDFIKENFVYTCVILYIKTYENLLNYDLISNVNIKEYLHSLGMENAYIKELSNSKFCILLSIPNNEQDKNSYICENIGFIKNYLNDNIKELNKIHIKFLIGKTYSNILDLNRSFKEANEIINYSNLLDEKDIISFDDIPLNKELYYFPEELQLKLMNSLKIGSSLDIENILDEIILENITKRELSYSMQKLFYFQLLNIALKSLDYCNIKSDETKEKLLNLMNLDMNKLNVKKCINDLKSIFLNLCLIVEENKINSSNQLIHKILDFLTNNYSNSDLSLALVADEFKLSEVYVSHLFKDVTQENFSSYLEKVRMNNAKNLLKSTSFTVKEIALKVGYNSSNTFCRAFKRYNNISPSEYRATL